MNCPVCDAKLRPVGKHGVEVDICPDCKGVWLDRGELDKILEMAAVGGPTEQREARPAVEERPRPAEREGERDHDSHDEDNRDRDRGHSSGGGKTKRRGSWLGDIFESFGGGD